MEKTSLYLPEELSRMLRDLARRTGRPQAALVREAIEAYLAAQGPRTAPRFLGAGQDTELASDEAKEWVRQAWGRPG